MDDDASIPTAFLSRAASILADTSKGLSGSKIVDAFLAYADDFDVNVPHHTYPFDAPNKRTALLDNLKCFSPKQQYMIIKELCDHPSLSLVVDPARKALKLKLISKYGHEFDVTDASQINENLISETKHWLQAHPKALSLFNGAEEKFSNEIYLRNLLDDLRLSLESLLKSVFDNEKSLENQIPSFGAFIKGKGGSAELANMFAKLVDYYSKYQNTYVKHNDAVIEEEIEFIFEITASFMKHVVRIHEKEM